MAKRSPKKKTVGSAVSTEKAEADWLWGLALFFAVALAYSPVWWAGFIWDDDLVLTANPVIVGPLGLREIWTTAAADICPLTLTTFWIEHKLWGLNPLPYHLVNVALHGINAILLWRVLRELRVRGAWLGAALWALHPVMVESVAWISELKNTESGLFYLLATYFFLKELRRTAENKRGATKYFFLTLLFAALAMLSKSSTIVLPLILCLCAWWIERRWNGRTLVKIAPIFLMSVAASLITLSTQSQHLEAAADPQWDRSWPQRIATSGDAIWFYLGKLLWPHPLMIVYPRWQMDAGQIFSYVPLAAVFIVSILLGINRKPWSRPFFFAWTYFVLALLPVLGLVENTFSRYSLVADHFQYLASMGPLALVGAGLSRLSVRTTVRVPWLGSILCAFVLLILGGLSWSQARTYQDSEKLWKHTLAWNPSCWAGYNNLGNILAQKGEIDEGISDLRKAVEISPDYAGGYFNLGGILALKGDTDEAIANFRKALELTPNDADTHHQLGRALAKKGLFDEATSHLQRARELAPGNPKIRIDLGNVLVQQGRLDEAIAEFKELLDLVPRSADAHNDLGVALAQEERFSEAVAQFQEAVQLRPDYIDAQRNLAKAQATLQAKPAHQGTP